MKVSECMSRNVSIAAPDETMQHAAAVMAELDAGMLPVGDGERLVGIVTDRDIAIRGVGSGRSPDTPVSEVMSSEVLYCRDTDDVEDVLANMGEMQVRRLPVVDAEKNLVGIVSIGDLAHNGSQQDAGQALDEITRPSMLHSQSGQARPVS